MRTEPSSTSAPPVLLRPAPSTPPPNSAQPAVVNWCLIRWLFTYFYVPNIPCTMSHPYLPADSAAVWVRLHLNNGDTVITGAARHQNFDKDGDFHSGTCEQRNCVAFKLDRILGFGYLKPHGESFAQRVV
ncbi:hypothetical protein B0H17DRAFT_1131052 [Mycena rosella]|uniref:Uncharacterized protein n=1 Tax=Mycena rosella TaxID=1033263 RepID=A0AAD7DNW2_MYCRO|nr:hypothetical protein B0H17DRAFT_1131052 [Mycena rosella]